MEHRDPYLRELGEPTYLVIDPRVKPSLDSLHPDTYTRLAHANQPTDNIPDLFCQRRGLGSQGALGMGSKWKEMSLRLGVQELKGACDSTAPSLCCRLRRRRMSRALRGGSCPLWKAMRCARRC